MPNVGWYHFGKKIFVDNQNKPPYVIMSLFNIE